MENLIDVHNHLTASEFDQDRHSVIEDAKKAGVAGMLVVSEFYCDMTAVLDLAKDYPNFCFPCLGIHPVQKDENGDCRSARLQDLEAAIPMIEAHQEKLVAIGEVGLDFTPYHCKTAEHKEQQKLVLGKQVELAKTYDLPLNVHSRSAGRPTVALLKEAGAERVLLHAFDGKPSVALEGVRAGYYFSIPPSIARSPQKEKLVRAVPLEHLLLETDSPALGPEKQVRNVPANIRVSLEYIARIKNTDEATVARVIWENTLKLFPRVRSALVK